MFFIHLIRFTKNPDPWEVGGVRDAVRKPACKFQLRICKKIQLLCKLVNGLNCSVGVFACCHFLTLQLESITMGTCAITGERDVRVIPFNFNDGYVIINAQVGDVCDFLLRIYCFAHFNHRVLLEGSEDELKEEFLLAEELVDSIISHLS